MQPRTGRIIQSAIVLDQDVDRPVRVSNEELHLVREGKAEAARGELLDARAFLCELQRQL